MRFPTWKEVESDPEFQSLEPTKKKEYFGKWSKTAVDRAMQQGLYRDEEFASGFTGWYNQKAKEYGEEEEVADFQQLSTRLRQPPKVGTSFIEEVTKIPAAIKSAVDQPLEAFGETAEVLGAPALAQTLKGAVEAPKDYKTAAESFMRPEEGEFQVAGFAPQYIPRAIVEQAGQLAGAVATRVAGGAIGGAIGAGLGSVVPGLGTAAGAATGTAAGVFTGPAVFEMAQIVGPVAKERAKNNGRTEPTNEDLAWAWTTAGTSGALNAIGAKYIPGGEKLVGGLAKKIAASIVGEGLTESGQSVAQQTGETIFTEKGIEVSPKEAIAEGIIGGAAGGAATAVFERADKKPEDPTKFVITKAAADELAKANQAAQELSANNAPLTAKVIQDNAAKSFLNIAENEEFAEESQKFAPPAEAITREELKTQYATLSDKELVEAESTFREDLESEDAETRSFAQNALNAIAEVKAEKAPIRKTELPTDVLPTETPAATYGREAEIYDVFAGVRQRPLPPSGPAFESAQVIEQELARAERLRQSPEGRAQLRSELQGEQMTGEVRRAVEQALATTPEVVEEGDVFAEVRRPTEVAPVEPVAPAEPTPVAPAEVETAASLSRVADNTATDEEVVRLARQGLVNIQDGQNVITPRGEEVMQRGGAPLPRLTPEERAAEVAAAPTPAAIVEQEPPVTEAPAITPAPAAKPVPVTPPPAAAAPAPEVAPAKLIAPKEVLDEIKQYPDFFNKISGDQSLAFSDVARYLSFRGLPKTIDAKIRKEFSRGGRVSQIEYAILSERETASKKSDVESAVKSVLARRGESEEIDSAINRYELEQSRLFAARQESKGRVGVKWADDALASKVGEAQKRVRAAKDALAKLAQPTTAPAAPTPVTTPPVTEAVIPAPAAPTPAAPEVAPIQRDVMKPEQMTPEEVLKDAVFKKDGQRWGVSFGGREIKGGSERYKDAQGVERVATLGAIRFKTKTEAIAALKGAHSRHLNFKLSKSEPVSAAAIESYGITLPEGYTKQGDLYVYQSATAPAEAAPVGIAVGNRVKTKTTPQSFVVEEVLPQSEMEVELGEQYYRIKNERTGEVQTVEANDIKPIKISTATKKMAPVRVEEKATPVPEADRYTFDEAGIRSIEFFGGKAPDGLLIVNDTTNPNYEMKAGYDPETGDIILNRAYIKKGESIEDILTHELGHYIFSDPKFQADFKNFLESMPDDTRAEIEAIINQSYNKDTNQTQIEERQVMAFTALVKASKETLSAWENLKNTIKRWINKIFGTNIKLSDEGAMAVFNVGFKRFKSGERIIRAMEEGTLRTAPEGMTQMDRDYLAAVERGDMETAQRMVDEAAKKAGYTIDSYHGTNGDLFTVFSTERGGDKTFAESARLGIFSTDNPDVAQTYAENIGFGGTFALGLGQGPLAEARDKAIARPEFQPLKKAKDAAEKEYSAAHKQLYDKYFELQKSQLQAAKDAFRSMLQNKTEAEVDQFIEEVAAKGAIQLFADDEAVNKNPQLIAAQEKINKATKAINDYIYPFLVEALPNVRVMQLKLQIKNPKIYDAKGQTPADFSLSDKIQQAKDLGHDGVIFENIIDPQLPATHYVVFEPQQIKSADPVTYDDAGNVIPLSQRFQPTQRDIRRMAPEPAPAPEAVVEEAPTERVTRRTKMQNIIDISTGVKRPRTKLTVDEMAALKDQIKMRARRRREDKRSQREFADALMSDIKALTMRGKVRPTQLRSITSKALRTQFDNDKSVQNFIEYFNKVIENANYEADLKSARDAQKSASVYKKRKNIPDNQREILDRISKANVGLIDDPLEFATAAREYMKAFVPATSKEYGVIPDSDMHSYLDEIQEEIDSEQERIQNETIKSAFEKVEKDEKLTRAEMKAYMGEENYTKYLEEQSEKRREKIEKAINTMANESKENLINYEPVDFTEEQMRIVKVLRKADIEGMSPDQKREYIQFVDSIVANNVTYGAGKVAATVESIANVNRWIKDKPNAAKGRAAFETLERIKTGLSTFGRSVPDIFREIFKKGSALGQIQQRMGIYDLTRGQVNANKMIDEIERQYEEFYKENNKKYPESMERDGLLAEGIVSYLIQREPQTDDAQSVKDRARKLQTAIDRWKENPKTRDYGSAAQAVFDKVMADSSDGILDKLKEQFNGNYKSLVWMRDVLLPKYRPMLKEFDENFQNQSSNYDESNYLPISYIKKFVSAERLNETNAAYDNRTFKVTQIASSIKRKKMENIPKDMDLDLNIRRGVFNNLAESISKSQTAPAWQRIISFLDAENADKVFGTEENKQMVLNILTGLKTSRERKAYLFDGADQLVDTLTSGARSVASSLALGGFTQPIKQMPEQLFSTAMNVNPFALGKNLMPKAQKDAAPLLDKFSIGQRADITAGTKFINQAESAYNRAEKYMESSKWLEAKDALGKANRLWLTLLTGSDVYAARAAWMSYYQQYLQREKIPFLGWEKEGQLVDTDPQRQAAATYAESITDIYQGASDPTRMALFAQRGRNAAENVLKAIFFNFNSFSVQQKSRFFSDARDLVSKTTDFEDKISAARGLTATIGGIVLFNLVRAYVISAISNAGVSLVYAMLGVDQDEPDEEQKKKDAEFKWKKFISGTMSNFFMGGAGQFAEEGFIDALNTASYWVESNLQTENVLNKDGSIMSYKTYERTNAPFWRYKAASTAPVPLGLFEIPLGQVEKLHDIVVNTLDEDKYENLTEEEKRIISFNSLVQFLYVTRIFGDVDVSRIVEKTVKDVEKQAKEREESQRKLMRMFQ